MGGILIYVKQIYLVSKYYTPSQNLLAHPPQEYQLPYKAYDCDQKAMIHLLNTGRFISLQLWWSKMALTCAPPFFYLQLTHKPIRTHYCITTKTRNPANAITGRNFCSQYSRSCSFLANDKGLRVSLLRSGTSRNLMKVITVWGKELSGFC